MNIKRILSAIAISVTFFGAMASDCDIAMGIAPISEGDAVPASISRKLEAKMKMLLSHVGVAAGDFDCQFFLTGRFDQAYSQEASGVGGRVLVKTDLQLAICDGENKKVFATTVIPLKGVGATDEQALTRAMSSLNANNPEFINFVEKGKKKIVEYFNSNYPTYITKAQKAMQARKYDEALYWATCIPECCNGYDKANKLIMTITADKMDYDGEMMLAQAESEWNSNPTAGGAAAAYKYISQIDPSSSAYSKAKELGEKMGKSVKADYDFETKEKYRSSVALEQQRIKAARDIGVAWAKNQPKTVYKTNWIRW